MIVASAIVFAPLYHRQQYEALLQAGRDAAETEWQQGEATWYVTRAEETHFTRAALGRYIDLQFKTDPVSGLKVRPMHSSWWDSHWQTAYRQRIEELLKESGKSPPDFGP